jgi:adenylylsulfate kinase
MIHVATPLEVCALRDHKGLYARAHAGVITNLTGVGEDYEVPTEPDIVVDMTSTAPEEAADSIFARLTALGCLGCQDGRAPDRRRVGPC